jgi:hypothetical protein
MKKPLKEWLNLLNRINFKDTLRYNHDKIVEAINSRVPNLINLSPRSPRNQNTYDGFKIYNDEVKNIVTKLEEKYVNATSKAKKYKRKYLLMNLFRISIGFLLIRSIMI